MKSTNLSEEQANEDFEYNKNTNASAVSLSSVLDGFDNKFEKRDDRSADLKDTNIINQTRDTGRERNVFGFFGDETKRGASHTIWVQFQGMGGSDGGGGFDYDPESRNQFVKFVFMIVFVMLLITAGFSVMVYVVESLNELFRKYGMIIMIAASILLLAMSYAMSCSECTRMPPCNFICLFLALVAMTAICSIVTVYYKTHLIMFALAATLATVFVCIMLACSSFDFTKLFIYIVVISTAFAAICLIYWIYKLATGNSMPLVQLGLLIAGTLINVIILTMELQMILGGRTMEIGESDYALAAFMLYTSIVDIFLRLVQLFGIIEELMGD